MNTNDILTQACDQLIISIEGLKKGSALLKIGLFGGELTLEHRQDCCESVMIEDFEGDIEDLVGHRLVSAEEVVNGDGKRHKGKEPDYGESTTWTFYRLRTTGGDLWVRWLGESNGYYSERVYVNWKPNGGLEETA
jgi:hypothetical protein